MVRPKGQSKRLTCSKKYKIIRKVKEHQKKVRKEEKNKSKASGKFKPKDPGIPNSYPFKEELLKQLKEKKEKEQEEREKLKAQRVKKSSKKRKLQDLQKDAEKRAKAFEKKQAAGGGEDSDTRGSKLSSGKSIEHSRKSFYKEFKKVVDASDVVIQVLDARDPLGCRCPQIEEIVREAGGNKRLVLLLNKIDLIPKKVAESWLKYLRLEFPTVAFKASTQMQRDKLAQSKVSIKQASSDLLNSSTCLGASALLKLLGNYAGRQSTAKGAAAKSVITVGVVGFPNVGKSSVINSLKRSRSCNVGSVPGMTRAMQEIQLDKHVKLLDSPGIIIATGSSDTQIILRNAVKVEQLQDPVAPVEAILKRCNKQQIVEKYCIADYKNSAEFLTLLASRLGKLKKGGIPDSMAAAKVLLQDWNSGKMSFYTHPPEHKVDEKHQSARVVQYFGAGFDLKAIEAEEANDLSGLVESLESALVIDPGRPAQMEAETSAVDEEDEEGEMSSGDDDDDDDDDDEDDDEEAEADMSAGEDNEGVKPKKAKLDTLSSSKEKSEEKQKKSDTTCDTTYQQINKENKKMFKNKQKMKRKEITKMLADDGNKMKDDDDDEYDFNSALLET